MASAESDLTNSLQHFYPRRHVGVTAWTRPHGAKFVAQGMITAPDGHEVAVRTIWRQEAGRDYARLVTAYPF